MEKVAVLGAGVMGLACAYELSKKGYAVEIFEADDRVGGMSAHFDFDGLSIERFYHFVCKPDESLFELLKELGIEDKLIWKTTKMGYYYQGKHYQWGNPVALLKFSELDLLSKLRYGVHMFYSTKISNWKRLDSRNAAEWIKKWIGERAYKVLWERLFHLKFHHYSDNLSAAWIWSRIKRVGLSRKSLLQEELGYLHGGSETLLKSLEQKLDIRKVAINLCEPVKQVTKGEDGRFVVNTVKRQALFDKVVSTIPLPFVSRIFPGLSEDAKRKYDSVSNIGVVCVLFKLGKKVTENFWLNISDPGIEIPGIIEFSNLRELPSNIVYIPYYMPIEHEKYKWPDSGFIDEAKEHIRKLNPEITAADFLAEHVSRYNYAQPICDPDFLSKLPPIKSEVEGLYLADTSYYYPEDRSISESLRLGKKIASMLISE